MRGYWIEYRGIRGFVTFEAQDGLHYVDAHTPHGPLHACAGTPELAKYGFQVAVDGYLSVDPRPEP